MFAVQPALTVTIKRSEDIDTGDFWWQVVYATLGLTYTGSAWHIDGGITVVARSANTGNVRVSLVESGAYDAVRESYYVVTSWRQDVFTIEACDSLQDAAILFAEKSVIAIA